MLQNSFLLENKEIKYKIIKSSRAARLKLQIVPGGALELIVPENADIEKAKNFLNSNRGWIKKHLPKLVEKKFIYFGKEIFIYHQINMFESEPRMKFENGHLIVSAAADYEFNPDVVFEYWLKRKAEKYIKNRVEYFAKKFGFSYNRITLRNQRTRWGSCSSKKNLSFNFYLMKYNKKVIDYVIVHELCHLKEMNHSGRFWSLVEEIIPDYKQYRKQLKGFI